MIVKNIGIIGFGYVGASTEHLLKDLYDIKIFDKIKEKMTHSKAEVMQSDMVFVCVPTPMKSDGTQDLSFVIEALAGYNEKTLYIIKSTVKPGTCLAIKKMLPKINIVFNPEFLTEANWEKDTEFPGRIVLGGEPNDLKIMKDFYSSVYKHPVRIYRMGYTEAELTKYMANAFLATKVSFMNEFKLLSDVLKLNWFDIVDGFGSDSRIGESHTIVPGPDGKLGYGGSCFPKDVSTIINFAEEQGVYLNTVKAGWITNLEVRPEKDWELLKGRAVL